jgi:hypothetical protein
MSITCSHCKAPMPPCRDGREIAAEWTVVRVEQHTAKSISVGYLYLCPSDMLYTRSRQVGLDLSDPKTPPPKPAGGAPASNDCATKPHPETP